MAASAWDLIYKTSPGSSRLRLFILAFVSTIVLLSYGRYYGFPGSDSVVTTDRCEDRAGREQQLDCPTNLGATELSELTVNGDSDSSSSSSSIPSSPSPSQSLTKHILNGIEISPPPPPADEEEYMAICLMVKNAAPELGEFVTHHYYHHGIRRFYVYDDGSTPKLQDNPEFFQARNNVPDSTVTFAYIEPDSIDPESEERKHLQEALATRCVKDHGSKHHWMGLFDVDEYLEMRNQAWPVLKEWLQAWEKYDDVGALGVQWLPHNSAGLVEIPASGFRHSYDNCVSVAPVDARGPKALQPLIELKNFVRPNLVDGISGIHVVEFNTTGVKRFRELDMEIGWTEKAFATHEYWALHHYATGSRKYFERKGNRGRMQGPGTWPVDQGYWDNYHKDVREYRCEELVNYMP